MAKSYPRLLRCFVVEDKGGTTRRADSHTADGLDQ